MYKRQVLRDREQVSVLKVTSAFQLRSQDHRSFIFVYVRFELENLTNEQPLDREGHTA